MKCLNLVVLLAVLLTSEAARALDVEVRALFSDAALLRIDGRERLMKAGDISDEGVRLLAADSVQALIEINGKQLALRLSEHISSRFESPREVSVSISMNPNRQYIAGGSINGRPVQFLVDTGANFIAMNVETATSLGVSLAEGTETQASTASDVVTMTLVTLRDVQVGEIRRQNVQALVSHSEYPDRILLGMSFLQHVDIRENAGLMVLTTRF